MGQPQLKVTHPEIAPPRGRPRRSPAIAALVVGAKLPPAMPCLGFLAVARTGSFSRAAKELGMEPMLLAGHVKLLEKSVGRKLVTLNSGRVSFTDAGQDVAQALKRHFVPLTRALDALRGRPQVLTMSLPAGAVGQALRVRIARYNEDASSPVCEVPSWSQATLNFRKSPMDARGENVFLHADEWAAVGSRAWQGGLAMERHDLLQAPLVSTSAEEADAWDALLKRARPKNMTKLSRQEARGRIASGAAIGISNIAFATPVERKRLLPVSRGRVWPGTGLWACLKDDSPAWDAGWALIEALRMDYAGEAKRRKS